MVAGGALEDFSAGADGEPGFGELVGAGEGGEVAGVHDRDAPLAGLGCFAGDAGGVGGDEDFGAALGEAVLDAQAEASGVGLEPFAGEGKVNS